jgi:hypothetical protein
MPRSAFALTALLASGLALAACSKVRPVGEDEYQDYRTKGPERGRLFGESSLTLGVGKGNGGAAEEGAALGVNAYLWRGALDTLGFMPLASADPFGGVIITDWYTPAEQPTERMKVQVTILDRELRADGVRVSVFKQQTSPKGGNWVDAQVDPRTNIDIENAILTRARQLRIAGGP